ncbi:sulfotransferase family 2 domain-containing protein [Methylobacterium sp. CB376]|uniref:sulfotransferase family 2 domain-containing protein n=1 Tax=unclassified Methylobacterium TaxID=2615210 RepID=UPI0014399425|nr:MULTISPECIES: sulfotransferase family 2 domain-containing protein [Methylobacterium]WFT80520.1 sulfotransferase family 2 domain-containing protein [Methylobacterium nodulans]
MVENALVIPKLFLIHIPKTAGTNIFVSLSEQVPAEMICPVRFNDLHVVPKSLLNKWTYFVLHCGFSHIRVIDGHLITATFIRDPVERFISMLRFLRRQKDNPSGLMTILNSINDYDFIMSSETENFATHLANDATFRLSQTEFAASEYDPGVNIADLAESKLGVASENLEKLDYIGLSECFDFSFMNLCGILGISASQKGRKINASAEQRPSIYSDEAVLTRIKYLTRFDNEIYQRGSKIFYDKNGGMKFELSAISGVLQERAGMKYVVHAKNGHVLIGPYIDLPAGRYKLEFQILEAELNSNTGYLRFDATAGMGSHLLAVHEEAVTDSRISNKTIIFDFQLLEFSSNIEFRVATEGVTAAVSRHILVKRIF